MNPLGRTLAVAEMQGRDLLRRRVVLILLVLLPVAWYYSVPSDDPFTLIAGPLGPAWVAAAAGLFGMLGWRRADERLTLAGSAPIHGLLGRLVVLQCLAIALVVLLAPQVLLRQSALLENPAALVLGMTLLAQVGVSMGLAIGALVRGELEGTLLIIGIVGIGISIPVDSAGAWMSPLWGPQDVIQIAAGTSSSSIGVGVIHALTSIVVLLGAAYWFWSRRVRVRVDRREIEL